MVEKLKTLRLCTCIFILVFGMSLTSNVKMESTAHAETTDKVVRKVDPKELACMAKNIFYEAGGEPILGQAAVARVVLNRISHGFGMTPCKVVYQSTTVTNNNDEKVKLCQFSWVCENKGEPNKNSHRYQQAKAIAYEILAHDAYKDVVPKTILYFHNTSVRPTLQYNEVKKIGNHIFYSKSKKKVAKKLSYNQEA